MNGRGLHWRAVAQLPCGATRRVDQIRIRQPIGGDIVLKAAAEGRLDMVIGGKTSRLARVPQDQ